MPVQRWTFYDPATADQWTVPINPREMSSLWPERALSTRPTTAIGGQSIVFEGNATPATWTFSGAILDHAHYENLRKWVYDKPNRIQIIDHFGRTITCALRVFRPTPKRALNRYWRHEYEIEALVFNVTAPTVEV